MLRVTRPTTSATRGAVSHSALVLLCAALGLSGCGGEDQGRPTSARDADPGPVDHCGTAAKYEFQNIVTFERPFNASIPCDPAIPCQSSPLYFNYDKAHSVDAGGKAPEGAICLSSVPPQVDPDGNAVNPSTVPGGARCGVSDSALLIRASNIGTCYGDNGRLGWGGSFDVTLSGDFYDASEWDGISFWVRQGKGSGSSFVFSVVDEENLGVDADPSEELHCGCREEPIGDDATETRIHCYSDPPSTFSDEQKCDAFGAAVTITPDWSFVAVSFAALRQKGFGFPSSLGYLDRSRLKRLQFLLNAGDWDFWIDDLAFFRAPSSD